MAKDPQTKSRKASAPAVDMEKPTKVKTAAKGSDAPLKKRKATEDVAPAKVKKSKNPAEPKASKKTKATPKDESDAIAPAVLEKVTAVEEEPIDEITAPKAPKAPKEKKVAKSKTKAPKKSAPEPVKPDEEEDKEDDEIALDDEAHELDVEEDDQTLALIKGFESDDDEDDVDNENAFKEGQEIPKLSADALSMTKKQQKKLKKLAEAGASDEPGVVYIGRIPHGFYENEMKAYFKQFGNILRLRVSRNKRTGASKHFAFIEFESNSVAEIVAKTMDSYLMFGHILKVKLIPAAQVHKDLFKGANKRFKKVPWNKIEGRKLDQGVSEEKWDERVVREESRRVEKAEKLKAIGYEFKAPKVKTTKQISKKEKAPIALADKMETDEPVTIETAPVVEEPSKPAKKGKKAKAAKETIEVVEESKPVVSETPAIPEEVEAPKPKKGRKAKVVKEVVEVVEVVEEVLPAVIDAPAKPKGKKRKAEAAVEAAESEPAVDVPEKKVKRKVKATLVVEAEDVVPEVSVEKVKKSKKSKK